MSTEELAVTFLWNASSTLSKQGHISNLIRSNLLNGCLVKSEFKFKLPTKSFGVNSCCSNCSTPWDGTNYISKMLPKKKLTKIIRRKYRSIAQNKNGRQSIDKMTSAEEKLYSKTLVIKCLFCDKKTQVNILKKIKTENDSISMSSQNTSRSINNRDQIPEISNKTPHKNNSANIRTQLINNSSKKKLQNLFYQTPSSKQSIVTPSSSESSASIAKKKRQRDKFAGLSKVACITSTPPTISDNPLRLMLKPRKVIG